MNLKARIGKDSPTQLDENPTAPTKQELDISLSNKDLNPNSERDHRRESKEVAIMKGLAKFFSPYWIIKELLKT